VCWTLAICAIAFFHTFALSSRLDSKPTSIERTRRRPQSVRPTFETFCQPPFPVDRKEEATKRKAMSTDRMGRDQVISPRVVEDLIARGSIVVVFEDSVLKLDSWADKHPGGRLAILHMVGKDATDEIMA
jgi:cytochrome b involved in lipid metabolism